MTVTTCLECHRDIDVTNFINALYRHNITIGIQVAIAIITKKPIPQGQAVALGFQAAQNAINDPMLPFVNDKSICKLCLQKYAKCWNCGRYVREVDYIDLARQYNNIIKKHNPNFVPSYISIESANQQLTVKSTNSISKLKTNFDVIKTMEEDGWVNPISYNCYVCLQ